MIIRIELSPDEDDIDVRDAIRKKVQSLGLHVDFIDQHKSLWDEHYARELNSFGWNHGDDWLQRKGK